MPYHCARKWEKEKYLVGKKDWVCSLIPKVIRCQTNTELSVPSEEKCSQLWVRHLMLDKCKISNICMHSISYWQFPDPPTSLFWTSFSCTPFFDPCVRSPVTQQFSVSFQGPKNKVLQHLALSAWKLNSFSIKHWLFDLRAWCMFICSARIKFSWQSCSGTKRKTKVWGCLTEL